MRGMESCVVEKGDAVSNLYPMVVVDEIDRSIDQSHSHAHTPTNSFLLVPSHMPTIIITITIITTARVRAHPQPYSFSACSC